MTSFAGKWGFLDSATYLNVHDVMRHGRKWATHPLLSSIRQRYAERLVSVRATPRGRRVQNGIAASAMQVIENAKLHR